MCPARPKTPTRHSTPRRGSRSRARRARAPRRLASYLGLVAVAAAVVLGHGQAEPGRRDTAGSAAEQASEGAVGPVRMVATNRVTLRRHKGTVTGDGSTVYVVNHTAFRPRRATVPVPPQVRARSWVVVDLDSGRLLGKHRARARLPQASTMKLLTGLTAIRTVPAGTRHRVTKFETSQICTCAGLARGRLYRRNTLLAGMLLPSGNDAAEAVAGSHPAGRRAFYRAMNRLADRLGADDTVAKNASGLTAPGSHSSARDLVIFLRAAVANPTLSGILAKRSAQIATVSGRHAHVVWRGTDYVNRYANSLGKSGYTTPAKNTLVVVTEIGGRRIAVATLGAPGGYSTSGARALTEWASRNFASLKSVGRLPHS